MLGIATIKLGCDELNVTKLLHDELGRTKLGPMIVGYE